MNDTTAGKSGRRKGSCIYLGDYATVFFQANQPREVVFSSIFISKFTWSVITAVSSHTFWWQFHSEMVQDTGLDCIIINILRYFIVLTLFVSITMVISTHCYTIPSLKFSASLLHGYYHLISNNHIIGTTYSASVTPTFPSPQSPPQVLLLILLTFPSLLPTPQRHTQPPPSLPSTPQPQSTSLPPSQPPTLSPLYDNHDHHRALPQPQLPPSRSPFPHARATTITASQHSTPTIGNPGRHHSPSFSEQG